MTSTEFYWYVQGKGIEVLWDGQIDRVPNLDEHVVIKSKTYIVERVTHLVEKNTVSVFLRLL